MTECNTQPVLFPALFSKPLHVSFSREHLSSNGGTVLLAARDKELGLTESLAGCMVDKRRAKSVDHELLEQLRQRVMSIAVGCPDGNDAAKLREDPMLKLACQRDPVSGEALASQPTLSRFENNVNGHQLLQMGYELAETVLAEQAKRRKGEKLRRIIIDIDPTCDPTYGSQQLTFFNGFYNTHCYLPLVITVSFGWDKRKYPVAAALRKGTAGPMVGTIAVLSRLIDLLREHFGSTRLYLRADAAFAVPELFDFMEAEDMRYAIAMRSNEVLERFSASAMTDAREQALATEQSVTTYGRASYQSRGWQWERSLDYKAQVLVHPDKDDLRDNDRYLVHNLDYRYGPEGAFTFYYGHSDMENNIKELKNDLSMDRTSCTSFKANQFRLMMTLAAYVLMQSVAERTTDLHLLKAKMGTIRDRILKIAVRVRSSARRITLEFTSHHPWADSWINAAYAVGAVPT